MSVLACGRSYCKNTMCNRLILGGEVYICNDCYHELCEFKKTWPTTMSAMDVRVLINDFLQTPVGKHNQLSSAEIDEEFRRLTEELSR